MESGVPQRQLRRHAHRSAGAPRRDRRPRRQELSAQRSRGTRCAKSKITQHRCAQTALNAMLKPNDLPLICLPVDLSDEAAATLLEFLQEFTEALESQYYAQITRYYRSTRQDQQDLYTSHPSDSSDPP